MHLYECLTCLDGLVLRLHMPTISITCEKSNPTLIKAGLNRQLSLGQLQIKTQDLVHKLLVNDVLASP